MSLWHKSIKPILKKTGIQKPYHRLKKTMEASRLEGKEHEELFNDIYQSNNWNGKESASGQGSDLEETKALLKNLPDFLTKYNVKTMIDLPCGDCNWIQHLEYDFEHYTGIDIVQALVDRNLEIFGSDGVSFEKKDCLKDDLGKADLLFCRDLLIHFSFEDCFTFFKNLKKSKIEYVLMTHFFDEANEDIATGQWHPVNFVAEPFNFPAPIDILAEETQMFNGRFAKTKVMALWKVSDLPG